MQNKNRILFDLDESFVYLWLRVFPDYLSIPICMMHLSLDKMTLVMMLLGKCLRRCDTSLGKLYARLQVPTLIDILQLKACLRLRRPSGEGGRQNLEKVVMHICIL